MGYCKINGEQRQAAGMTVTALLAEMRLGGQKLAVEKNGAVIPKSRHDDEILAEGDIIEIVAAVGGG